MLPPLRPLTQIGKAPEKGPWQSAGIKRQRPTNCGLCRFSYKSVGFTATFVGKTPKIGLVFPHPDSEEVVAQEALESSRGRHFTHTYLEPFGLTKEDLVISYCIRCLPPWSKRLKAREFPGGTMRVNAQAVCSRYDRLHGKDGDLVSGGIVGFNPDLFVFSFDPADTIRIPSYTRLIQRCIERALHFHNCGFRPCILFGEESVMVQFPQLKAVGGLKNFLGHYIEQPWKSAPDKELDDKKAALLKAA